jgi:hypothetical protein
LAWDDEKFRRFVDATIRMARGELPGYGFPHVVFPYPPTEEMTCIARVRGLPGRFNQAGFSAELVPVAQYVAEAVSRYARPELRDRQEYERLQSDLSDPRAGVVPKTSELLKQRLTGRLDRGTILVLCRLGALYPFGHVSAFLEALYTVGVRNTLAVAYPGTAEGTQLRFLGLVDPTGGYRGHIVT